MIRSLHTLLYAGLFGACMMPVGEDMKVEDAPVIYKPDGIPAVAPITPKHGWWSGNNQIGYEVGFEPNAQNRQTVLKFDERGPPKIYTVSLGMTHGSVTGVFAVRAILQFGSGGVVQEVTIDWLEGAAITLPFNALNVIAFYTAGAASIPANLRLRVNIAEGTSLHAMPTFTQNVSWLPGGFATPLPKVPNFAKAVHSIIAEDIADIAFISAATTHFELFSNDTGVTAAGAFDGTTFPEKYPNGFPIQSDARFWNVDAAAPGFEARVVFSIGL